MLNNVTNSTVSNCAAQVVGRAAVPTAVVNKSLPANYNQSAAVRVAAVLAKSAAGQTVGHQQLPHQARFFGHNPNLKRMQNLIYLHVNCLNKLFSSTTRKVFTWLCILNCGI